MSKSCRLILLKNRVRKPCKAITENGYIPQKSLFSARNHVSHDSEDEEGSHKMKNPSPHFRMFREIKFVKICEIFNRFCHIFFKLILLGAELTFSITVEKVNDKSYCKPNTEVFPVFMAHSR